MRKFLNFSLSFIALVEPLLLNASPPNINYSSDLYRQEKLLKSKNYKKLSPQQQREKKISYFLSKKEQPLKNRIITWGAISVGWIIAITAGVISSYHLLSSSKKYFRIEPVQALKRNSKTALQQKIAEIDNLSIPPENITDIFNLKYSHLLRASVTELIIKKDPDLNPTIAEKMADSAIQSLCTEFQNRVQQFNTPHLKNREYYPFDSITPEIRDAFLSKPFARNNEILTNAEDTFHRHMALHADRINLTNNTRKYEEKVATYSVRRLQVCGLVITGAILAAPFLYLAYKSFRATYQAMADRYWDRLADPIEPWEKKYLLHKKNIPLPLQIKIEELFALTRKDLSKLKEVRKFVDTVLALPQNYTKITFNQDKIDQLLKGYPLSIKKQITNFILQQTIMQSAKNSNSTKKGNRIPFYFQGVPGTGKTRLAKLIGEALKLPVTRISLEGARISDLVGRSLDSSDPTPGLILEALTQAQANGNISKNMILFIDEADRVINHSKSEVLPFILKILDPTMKNYFNPYLNTNIDISHLTIILAGNYQIKDKALQNRFHITHFKGFSVKYKKQIIWDNALNKICQSFSQSGKYVINMDDFTPEDKEKINDLIEMDTDLGFRTIEKILIQYVNDKIGKKYNLIDGKSTPNFKKNIQRLNKRIETSPKHKN